ncbi:MAG: hypothetical protein SF029_23795 [bacterium]|nr:hypothetical protein [bacterium]
MSIKVRWSDEHPALLHFDIRGRWNWQEFYLAFERACHMNDSSLGQVDAIVNFLESGAMQPGALNHFRHLAQYLPENAGLIVLVSASEVKKALYRAGCGLFPGVEQTLHLVTELEEAENLVLRERNREDA